MAAEIKLDQLQNDVAELKKLEELAQQARVKTMLNFEMRKVELEIQQLSATVAGSGVEDKKAIVKRASDHVLPYVQKIQNYGWDQSDKFVKVYVSELQGVQDLEKGAIHSDFKEDSFELSVKNLKGKTYVLHISNLLKTIVTEQSHVKIKTNMVIVMLKKEQERETWSHMTKHEAAEKDKKFKPPKVDDKSDPSAGLMNMMKQMYEEGDDEMKRTIAKAWTEGQDKKKFGDMPGGDF